jgi:hypothetical protein
MREHSKDAFFIPCPQLQAMEMGQGPGDCGKVSRGHHGLDMFVDQGIRRGHVQVDRHAARHQIGDIGGEARTADRGLAAGDVQMHAMSRRLIGRRKLVIRPLQDQHAAAVGPPIIAQFREKQPAAKKLSADFGPGGIDAAAAAGMMRAKDAGVLLKLRRWGVE